MGKQFVERGSSDCLRQVDGELKRFDIMLSKFVQFVSNFPRKSKLKHILILGGEKFKKIRKFENVKNIEKLKMSFSANSGNDSTSARLAQYAKDL